MTTTSARTAEVNAADALAQLLYMLGDSDNLQTRVTEFEDSFPSPIVRAESLVKLWDRGGQIVEIRFEDGSVLHLTVSLIKEPTPVPVNPQWNGPIRASELGDQR